MASTTRPITITDATVLRLLKEVAEENGLNGCEIERAEGKNKGEGYLGEVSLVRISGTDSQSKRKTMDLVVKCASKSENLRNQLPIAAVYKNELHVYNTVFPTFEKFEKDRNVTRPFSNRPKCFKTGCEPNNETLILQDLNALGYLVWNRRLVLPDAHTRLVFATFGHFHAISFAMRDQRPDLLAELTKDIPDLFRMFAWSFPFVKMVSYRLEKVREAVDPGVYPQAAENLRRFSEELDDFFKEVHRSVDQYSVLLHGDNWITNMLFKCQQGKDPTDVALVDFQITRLGPPVLDLSYFFYVSASKSCLDNLEEYLTIYYDALSKNLQLLGTDPEQVYPYEVLKSQWKKYSRYGLSCAMVIINSMLADDEECADLGEVADSGQNVAASFNYEIKNKDEYNRRITDVILHFSQNDFF